MPYIAFLKCSSLKYFFFQDSTAGDTTPTAEQGVITPQVAVLTQKQPLDSTNEEEEPAQDIEMPPPMEIQDHSFKPESKEVSTDDVTAKLVGDICLFAGSVRRL